MMKKGGLRNKLESFHLSFDTEELTKSIHQNVTDHLESSFLTEGKRVWMKDNRPVVLDQIDKQIRKNFKIDSEKTVFSLYYPPDEDSGEKKLLIKDPNQNIGSRVIISTINEYPEIKYGSQLQENIELKGWVAYLNPPVIGNMISYTFQNNKRLVIPAKKGFRQVSKSKNIKNRYILIFDYVMTKSETNDIFKNMEKLMKNIPSNKLKEMKKSSLFKENESKIEEALKELTK